MRLAWIIALLAAAIAVIVLATRGPDEDALAAEAELQRIRAAGQPTTLAEARPEPPPAGENAAPLIREIGDALLAIAAAEEASGDMDQFQAETSVVDLTDTPWTPDEAIARRVREGLVRRERALAGMDAALARPGYDLETDWLPFWDPDSMATVSGCQAISRWLAARAAMAAREGRGDEAWQDTARMLRFAELALSGPTLVHVLTKTGVQLVAVDLASKIAERHAPPDRLPRSWSRFLTQSSVVADFREVLLIQRAMGLDLYEAIRTGDPAVPEGMALTAGSGWAADRWAFLEGHRRLHLLLTPPVEGTSDAAVGHVYIGLSRDVTPPGSPELARMLLAPATILGSRILEMEAWKAVARAGIALEDRRRPSGTMREGLCDDIAEDDPWTDTTLRCLREPDGSYVVWSADPEDARGAEIDIDAGPPPRDANVGHVWRVPGTR